MPAPFPSERGCLQGRFLLFSVPEKVDHSRGLDTPVPEREGRGAYFAFQSGCSKLT